MGVSACRTRLRSTRFATHVVGLNYCLFVTIMKLVNFVGVTGAVVVGVAAGGRRCNMLRTINVAGGRLGLYLRLRKLVFAINAVYMTLVVNLPLNCTLFSCTGRGKVFKVGVCRIPVMPVFVVVFLINLLRVMLSYILDDGLGGRALMREVECRK